MIPPLMPFAFGAPEYLLLILPLGLLVWLIGRRSLSGLDPLRRRAALGLRILIVALIVAGLAEVQWRDLTDKVDVIVVVDHSRSIPDAQTQRALAMIDGARKQIDPRRDSGKLVVFGREAFVEQKLLREGEPITRVASDLERGYTSIDAAIRGALAAVEPGTRGRIVLVSDGNQTLGDAREAVARARAAKVPVDVVPIEYAYERELVVEKIVIPGEAKVGEPFTARVVIHATAPTPAKVHLWKEGAVLETREVVLQPGANVEQFQVLLDRADFFRVEATVEPIGGAPGGGAGDQMSQNNTAHGFVFARGKASVMYVHDVDDPQGREGQHLLAALDKEQVRVTPTSAVDVPLEPMALQGYDCVILDNVRASSLSERQQSALATACGDMGVGLIMIGGDRSFGAGEWAKTPIEEALPVEMEIKQEEVIPDGALCMIIHSCEFPDGNALAVKVCKKAVDNLSGKDSVGVLIFGPGNNQWVVPMQKAQNKTGIKNAINGMQAMDMPDFDGIFRMALSSLKTTNASVKHMILMSDGDPSPPSPSLLNECQQQKITVSTICYFSHDGAQGPSAQVMRRIANMTGGKFYYLEKAEDLPQIFIKEAQRVARSLIVNKTFVPQVRTPSPVLTGVEGLPAVTGYVLTEPKPRAEVALVSDDGSPVLAHWQFGLGKALAFTSDAKPEWATAWVQWDGYRRFWSQAVRWASKDVQESFMAVSTTVKGDRGVVVLDAVTPDGEVVDGLQVKARIVSPRTGATQEVILNQRGPGRYEGDFPVDDVGTYTVNLSTTDQDGKSSHSVTTGLVFPYSDEYKRLRSDRPFLEELARQGDGQVLDMDAVTKGEVNLWDRARLGEKVSLEERWPWALALGLFLFLLDVGVRRVAVDWTKVWARGKAALTRSAPPPASTMDRLRERKVVAREAAETKFMPSPQSDGSAAARVDVAGVATPLVAEPPKSTSATGGPVAPRPAATSFAPQQQEGDAMSRLLKAKKRAREQQSEGEEPSPPKT